MLRYGYFAHCMGVSYLTNCGGIRGSLQRRPERNGGEIRLFSQVVICGGLQRKQDAQRKQEGQCHCVVIGAVGRLLPSYAQRSILGAHLASCCRTELTLEALGRRL